MPLCRPRRPWVAAITLLSLSPLIATADSKPTWNVSRLTPPENVGELLALQETVKAVVQKTTPATVGIWILNAHGDREGAGSGVIVSGDGLVLTAEHVIAPPDFGRRSSKPAERSIEVELYDGRKVAAKTLGRYKQVDIGMVKITDAVPKDAKWEGAKEGKWPFAEVGDSSSVKPGQWVVTLGHPGGPKPDRRAPVRVGQIRKKFGRENKENVLASDCALVGGDSGGPLFDMGGRLIGIHSRIGLSMGDNYHIPTGAFKERWNDLVAGKVIAPRAFMGVVLNRENEAEPKILEVHPDTPAAAAGLKANDLILKFNNERVQTSDEVDELVKASRPGERVRVEVQRGMDTKTFSVTLGRLPDSEADVADGQKK